MDFLWECVVISIKAAIGGFVISIPLYVIYFFIMVFFLRR